MCHSQDNQFPSRLDDCLLVYKASSKHVESPTVSSSSSSSLSVQSDPQYFFLIRHGIYLSTSRKDDGLIELGRKQAYAAAETIDVLAHSIEKSSNKSSRILFTDLIQSGYKRTYQTGLITGHRLEEIERLEQSFDNIYKCFKCWNEIHSIERFHERWKKIQRLFFSTSSNLNKTSKNYVIFSHGNLLSSIINFLMSGASLDQWQFGNIAPHCSVSVLSYKQGDLLPQIIFKPFQIVNQSLPITINNVNPKKMRLKEIITNGIINEQIWTLIINSIIPERVVGSYTDQISIISQFIPDNEEEARRILFIFNQYYSQIMTNKDKLCIIDTNIDSDNEEEEDDDDDEDEENDG
ncbi:unnamed protein product [Rotaria sordida]|uniref:Uncharacterized protein n=1 Tax=Rotaria sordida TaxID=392033 RepID=A0A819A9F6_9BILA|nr:unnamed protein product [Rotaria sordida]